VKSKGLRGESRVRPKRTLLLENNRRHDVKQQQPGSSAAPSCCLFTTKSHSRVCSEDPTGESMKNGRGIAQGWRVDIACTDDGENMKAESLTGSRFHPNNTLLITYVLTFFKKEILEMLSSTHTDHNTS